MRRPLSWFSAGGWTFAWTVPAKKTAHIPLRIRVKTKGEKNGAPAKPQRMQMVLRSSGSGRFVTGRVDAEEVLVAHRPFCASVARISGGGCATLANLDWKL